MNQNMSDTAKRKPTALARLQNFNSYRKLTDRAKGFVRLLVVDGLTAETAIARTQGGRGIMGSSKVQIALQDYGWTNPPTDPIDLVPVDGYGQPLSMVDQIVLAIEKGQREGRIPPTGSPDWPSWNALTDPYLLERFSPEDLAKPVPAEALSV